MVREEEIGKQYVVTKNGIKFYATITQDPNQYEFYSSLDLDVFVRSEREEIIDMLDYYGIDYRKNSKTETLKKKLDDYIAESDI